MSKLKAQAAVVAKRIADYKASDSCAKRRGTRPRLAAQERLTQSARRLAGVRRTARGISAGAGRPRARTQALVRLS